MEPIAYFLGFGSAIFGYLFYALYKREFSYDQLSNVTVNKRQAKLMKIKGLDVQVLNELKHQRVLLQVELKKTQLLQQ